MMESRGAMLNSPKKRGKKRKEETGRRSEPEKKVPKKKTTESQSNPSKRLSQKAPLGLCGWAALRFGQPRKKSKPIRVAGRWRDSGECQPKMGAFAACIYIYIYVYIYPVYIFIHITCINIYTYIYIFRFLDIVFW